MASLDDLITESTTADWVTRVLDGLRGYSVPVSSWLSKVNIGLALSWITGDALAELRNIVRVLAQAANLETAEGLGLSLLAQGVFRLTRYPPVPARHYFILYAVSTAPAQTIVAGELTVKVGTQLFTADGGGTLSPGAQLVLPFTALSTGPAGNIPTLSTINLVTSLVGASVGNPGSLLAEGQSANGGIIYTRAPGPPAPTIVQVAGGALGVVVASNTITVTYAPATTAEAAAAAVNAAAPTRVFAQATGDGSGLLAPFAAEQISTSLIQVGQKEEEDGSLDPTTANGLKGRCAARWSTTGYGGGNVEAMAFWARSLPAGAYQASPVTKVKVYDGRLPDGTIHGGACTVLVAGEAGALSTTDLASVAAIFENPKKYPIGCTLYVRTTTTLTITLVGFVYLLRSAGISPSDAAGLVASKFAEYTAELPIGGIGGLVYKQRLEGKIEEAIPAAVRNVVLSSPTGNTTVAWNESVAWSLGGLSFELVDG